MYKDKDKQREANRRAKQRQRVKALGMQGREGMTSEQIQGMMAEVEVIPDLELCKICLVKLPPLEKLRQYPGVCLRCVNL